MPPRRLVWFLAGVLALTAAGCGRDLAPGGLVVGHVDHAQAVLAVHAPAAGRYELTLEPEDGGDAVRVVAQAGPSTDHALRWLATSLRPATGYRATARTPEGSVLARASLRTAPRPGAPARVRLVLGSCASMQAQSVWTRIAEHQPDALVLLGDTPYIDSTDLALQRAAHRRFLAVPSLARLLRTTPLWSTWDDHDYGADNADGTLPGKENARRAFLESRPQTTYGAGGEGVYTRVRHGPVEVFLLDVRWFAGLEAAATDPGARSLLGGQQRRWLEDSLRASDAPLKLLCCGMVWRDKGGRSEDDWATYRAERDALFAFLGEARIDGCVLVGGDVHACQHAVYEQTAAGYPLHEFVVSPLSERAWRGGDRRHPARRWGSVTPHAYLCLDVDTRGTPRLVASWWAGETRPLHTVEVGLASLRAR